MARGDVEEQRRLIPPGVAEAEDVNTPVVDDDKGAKEAAQLGSGAPIKDLEREAKENEHRRSQQFKDHFEFLSIVMLDILFAGFAILATIWVLHLVLPEKPSGKWFVYYFHCWLTKDQLDDIAGVLAGGVIAGLVADHFKRRMGS